MPPSRPCSDYPRRRYPELQPPQGRLPSRALHIYWVGNLRLVLDVQVSSGKQHSSLHAKAGLGTLLDELDANRHPKLVSGDSGYTMINLRHFCKP